jgi:hypothetical protein
VPKPVVGKQGRANDQEQAVTSVQPHENPVIPVRCRGHRDSMAAFSALT